MKKILVVGSSNVDFTYVSDSFPEVGETLIAKEMFSGIGGKGLNQAVAISLMGSDVTFLTALGDDGNKDFILRKLEQYNLKVVPIIKNCPTGNAFINVNDSTGDNKILIYGGANVEITKEDIDNNIDLIKECDYVLLQLEVPVNIIAYIVDIARRENKIVILNPAPYRQLDGEILSKLDYVIPNKLELSHLSGDYGPDYKNKARSLIKRYGVKNVIVTLGGDGAFFTDGEHELELPARHVRAVDTTGAGDCFNGVLAAFLAKDASLQEALEMAIHASGMSVSKHGTVASYPDIDHIKY